MVSSERPGRGCTSGRLAGPRASRLRKAVGEGVFCRICGLESWRLGFPGQFRSHILFRACCCCLKTLSTYRTIAFVRF